MKKLFSLIMIVAMLAIFAPAVQAGPWPPPRPPRQPTVGPNAAVTVEVNLDPISARWALRIGMSNPFGPIPSSMESGTLNGTILHYLDLPCVNESLRYHIRWTHDWGRTWRRESGIIPVQNGDVVVLPLNP